MATKTRTAPDAAKIRTLEKRVKGLESQLSGLEAGSVKDVMRAGATPRAVPADKVDGQILTAAEVNAIKNNIYQWQASVDANQFNLTNAAQIEAQGTGGVIARNLASGSVTGFLAHSQRTFAAGDSSHIYVYGSGGAAGTHDYGVIEMGANPGVTHGGAARMNFFCGGQSATSAAACLFFQVEHDGTSITAIRMRLGGTLKTLSVDGSGFVKAT